MPKETYEDFVRESLRLYPPKPPRIFVIDQTDAEALQLLLLNNLLKFNASLKNILKFLRFR